MLRGAGVAVGIRGRVGMEVWGLLGKVLKRGYNADYVLRGVDER